MTDYICNRNRLDWDGNSGAAVRRGERFEMDDERLALIMLDDGYILPVIDEPEFEKPMIAVSDQSLSNFDIDEDSPDEPQTREFKGIQEHKHGGVNNWHPADREHKNLE